MSIRFDHQLGPRGPPSIAAANHTPIPLRALWMIRPSGEAGSPFETSLGRKTRNAARIAIPVIVLNGVPGLASAQTSATWLGVTHDWNDAANWTPGPPNSVVPTGTATFDNTVTDRLITFAGPAEVGALQFNGSNYTFDYLPGAPALTITGFGINPSPGDIPTFNITRDAPMNFRNSSTAGTSVIFAGLPIAQDPGGFQGGFIKFFNDSTAGNAAITAQSGSNIEFHNSSSAGSATLVSTGGDILINDKSTAGNATISVHSQSMMEIGHNDGGSFLGGGSAGNANITVEGGGFMRFETTGTADAAKITIDGSTSRVAFYDDSTAAQATITVNSGGTLDFSPDGLS